jgi:hypothetical protein
VPTSSATARVQIPGCAAAALAKSLRLSGRPVAVYPCMWPCWSLGVLPAGLLGDQGQV